MRGRRIELLASSMSTTRSTTELTAQDILKLSPDALRSGPRPYVGATSPYYFLNLVAPTGFEPVYSA